MDVQIPEPRLPLANLNGKFTLPSLSNGNWAASQPASGQRDDPPTVPLPTVQGGLRDYAARRESPPSQQESGPGVKLEMDPLPGQALIVRSAPAIATPLPTPLAEPEPLPVSAPSIPAVPPDEPKMSSLSLLEQLAYGGSGNTSSGVAGPAAPPQPESPLALRPPAPAGGLEDGVAAANAAPGSAMAALNSLAALAPAPPGAEGMPPLHHALETFAEQVGASCIATAVIRTDGMLVAEYKVRRGQDQDLGSPAYHMAQVMQSSLRALLMGGWGDLEDTIITGSTHSVMLRRLGRAEKGLFHVAVLERSGNPGLCRVRMRGNETALLQALSVDIPSAPS
jgi:predicted regulator of Ras-like GTPase activity (Roadblock/LC7/MglB family)